MYINLAIVGNATYLVSRDKDLLDLMTTSTDIARQFRSRYPFLRIMTPAGLSQPSNHRVPPGDDDGKRFAGSHIRPSE
jgi:predicted nucleic acid-binding protein